jgi:hypothetical protein
MSADLQLPCLQQVICRANAMIIKGSADDTKNPKHVQLLNF